MTKAEAIAKTAKAKARFQRTGRRTSLPIGEWREMFAALTEQKIDQPAEKREMIEALKREKN